MVAFCLPDSILNFFTLNGELRNDTSTPVPTAFHTTVSPTWTVLNTCGVAVQNPPRHLIVIVCLRRFGAVFFLAVFFLVVFVFFFATIASNRVCVQINPLDVTVNR